MAKIVQRMLNNRNESDPRTSFGYERNGKVTVDVIVGCDHGQGATRWVARLNLLSSSERRKVGRIDFGSEQITFSKTVCCKDNVETMKLTSDKIREHQSSLERLAKMTKSKLVLFGRNMN